jgi:hypothetical protein
MRRNEAARWIANDIMQNKKGISKLDPVMKDKLVADEVQDKTVEGGKTEDIERGCP